ncbi:MAG: tripartite tricarboxylate transporter substrate binding protein [Desulfovibrionaceae bacterium]
MRMSLVKLFVATLSLVTILGFSPQAFAAYPKKTITIVVPFAPGGQADICARMLAQALQPYFPKIAITNMGSANGTTGAAYVAAAKPDGYTLLLAWLPSVAIAPAIMSDIPYSWDSFDYLGLIQRHSFVLVGNTKHPIQNFEALRTALKAGEKNIRFATAGFGTLNYLAPLLMLEELGLPEDAVKFIPFKGAAPAAPAVMGGHMDFLWQGLAPLTGALQGKQLTCLAITSSERDPAIPACPTVRELGLPNMESIVSWGAMAGPKGLPQEVINAWAAALEKVKQDPAWNAALTKSGAQPAIMTPTETRAYVKSQFELFGKTKTE